MAFQSYKLCFQSFNAIDKPKNNEACRLVEFELLINTVTRNAAACEFMLRSSHSLDLSLAHAHSAFPAELRVWGPNYSAVIIGKFLWTMEYAIYCSQQSVFAFYLPYW